MALTSSFSNLLSQPQVSSRAHKLHPIFSLVKAESNSTAVCPAHEAESAITLPSRSRFWLHGTQARGPTHALIARRRVPQAVSYEYVSLDQQLIPVRC